MCNIISGYGRNAIEQVTSSTESGYARVILQCNRYTKIEHMLQALQFMSIKQRLHYNVCIFIFKILHNLAPKDLRNRLEIISREDGRKTRQDGTIGIKLCRTRSAQKSLYYEGVKLYNALPAEIRNCDKNDEFKRILKNHIYSASLSNAQ